MNVMHKLTLLIVLLLFVSACTLNTVHKWEETMKPGKLELHIVKKVINGTQIKLSNDRIVKYVGVDSPKRGQFYFKKSYEANAWLLRKRKIFLKFVSQEPDEQGRYLAYAYAPAKGVLCFINQELVQFGYATVDENWSNSKYKKKFLKLQREAKLNKKGIWSRS